MDNSAVVVTLNTLLTLTRDGAADFEASSQLVENLKIKELLRAAAKHCRTAAHELSDKVSSLGGAAAEGESLSESLHIAWTELRSKVAGMSETEVLDECVRSEEAARTIFEQALATELPADVKSLIQRQYEGVRQHYELVRGLRSAFVLGHSRT